MVDGEAWWLRDVADEPSDTQDEFSGSTPAPHEALVRAHINVSLSVPLAADEIVNIEHIAETGLRGRNPIVIASDESVLIGFSILDSSSPTLRLAKEYGRILIDLIDSDKIVEAEFRAFIPNHRSKFSAYASA
ncbi:hypothetical protein Back2_00640 [Nocardioides baekrokdamisoli]|uniref:Uncharacterized protein n=1 Tax=Nocardioides baekrokdamisoli TaxID=1804624 RepID=A0A3G9IAK7_9ACTN|nr:hypothetical protein [Nocardioides baekrokdamisoli]BBH15777.1 hypothetical protein Back2_00640 [Nocardioides baekrokdamisoli]